MIWWVFRVHKSFSRIWWLLCNPSLKAHNLGSIQNCFNRYALAISILDVYLLNPNNWQVITLNYKLSTLQAFSLYIENPLSSIHLTIHSLFVFLFHLPSYFFLFSCFCIIEGAGNVMVNNGKLNGTPLSTLTWKFILTSAQHNYWKHWKVVFSFRFCCCFRALNWSYMPVEFNMNVR